MVSTSSICTHSATQVKNKLKSQEIGKMTQFELTGPCNLFFIYDYMCLKYAVTLSINRTQKNQQTSSKTEYVGNSFLFQHGSKWLSP